MSDLDEFTIESAPARLRIVGTWLVEESDGCTGGACGLGYGHEPGCGQEPIVDLATVPGWGDLVAPLIEARVREARADALAEVAEALRESALTVERTKGASQRTWFMREMVGVLTNRAREVRR